MTPFDPLERRVLFERELRDALDEEVASAHPDYLTDVLVRTTATRQRPAWTFIERWLPVSTVPLHVSVPTRTPWGVLVAGALVIAVLIGALLVAGSRPSVPSPFGLAGDGLVAHARNGDILTTDPATGSTRSIVTGAQSVSNPIWSRDGTRLVFERSHPEGSQLVTVGANGSDVTLIADGSFVAVRDYAFSPDGQEVAFIAVLQDTSRELLIAKADGTGVRRVDVGVNPADLQWLPPAGSEILFTSADSEGLGSGLWAVDTSTGSVRTILAPVDGVARGLVKISPDGSSIAFTTSVDNPYKNTYEVHVVGNDGTGERVLPMPAGATFQDAPAWSNAGTRLAVVRGYGSRNEEMAVAIMPADGSDVGVETEHGLTGCCDNWLEWSPADTSILFLPEDYAGRPVDQLLIDPSTGATSKTSWAGRSLPAWQRLAP